MKQKLAIMFALVLLLGVNAMLAVAGGIEQNIDASAVNGMYGPNLQVQVSGDILSPTGELPISSVHSRRWNPEETAQALGFDQVPERIEYSSLVEYQWKEAGKYLVLSEEGLFSYGKDNSVFEKINEAIYMHFDGLGAFDASFLKDASDLSFLSAAAARDMALDFLRKLDALPSAEGVNAVVDVYPLHAADLQASADEGAQEDEDLQNLSYGPEDECYYIRIGCACAGVPVSDQYYDMTNLRRVQGTLMEIFIDAEGIFRAQSPTVYDVEGEAQSLKVRALKDILQARGDFYASILMKEPYVIDHIELRYVVKPLNNAGDYQMVPAWHLGRSAHDSVFWTVVEASTGDLLSAN